MSNDETVPPEPAPDDAFDSRRARLAVRRRRFRWAGVLVVAVIIGAAGSVAAFAFTDDEVPAPTLTASGDDPSSTIEVSPDVGRIEDDTAVRALSHEDPLRLWVGGDSLAGGLGPALGELTAASGIVQTNVDYKVSSGLASDDIRDWPEVAAEDMAEDNPEVTVFMIGANDATIASSHDGNDDGVPDWEPTYRANVAEMMDLFVGQDPQRLVLWIGSPTMRDDDKNDGAIEVNRVMREEAEKRAPHVVYVDAYTLFADENGEYTSDITLSNGEEIRARVADGVHFTPDGAEYLARTVFTLLDGRFQINAQADPENRIEYEMTEGGEFNGGGSGSDDDWNDDDDDDDWEPPVVEEEAPVIEPEPSTTLPPVPPPDTTPPDTTPPETSAPTTSVP